MNALEAISHKTGAFVLGVDHFGKAVETGTRGSSAKESAADVVLAMLATRDEAGSISNTRMAIRKVRGGRCGYEIPYALDVVTVGETYDREPITTCIVNWQTDRISGAAVAAVKERWPVSLKVFRDALITSLAEHGIRAWRLEQRPVSYVSFRSRGFETPSTPPIPQKVRMKPDALKPSARLSTAPFRVRPLAT